MLHHIPSRLLPCRPAERVAVSSRHRDEPPARPQRLAVTAGKLDSPGPSGPVRIPDRRVIAQARVAFEVRLDNARPDGTGVLTGDEIGRAHV